jgi:glycine cleavage system H protein
MASPADRKYLASHEWHKPEGDLIVVGISQFAVDELTDITFLEITADGRISAGDTIGEIESVKATSELYSGVSGEIVEVNQAVMDDPSIINDDCYDKGWMLKIRPSDPADYDKLIAADEYDKQAH